MLTTSFLQAKPRRVKRRKTNAGKAAAAARNRVTRASTTLSALFDVFQHNLTIRTAPEAGDDAAIESTRNENEDQSQSQGGNDGFESTMEGLLPEYLEARRVLWAQSSDVTLPVRLKCRRIRLWCSCA